MFRARSVLALVNVLALTAMITGCGGDDEDDDGANSANLGSCKQVCDAQVAAMCPIAFPADACKQICDAFAQTNAGCQAALKNVSDCQLAQADVCSIPGCDAEEMAYQQACNM